MKKNNWKSRLSFIGICMAAGFIVGLGMVFISINELVSGVDIVSRIIHMMPYLYIVALISGLVGIGSYVYFNIKLKKDKYSDEEGSFYERNEKLLSLGMLCATLSAIINLTAFGANLIQGTGYNFLFIVNALLAMCGEVKHVSLIRKVRPELDADPMGKNFNRNYFDKLDECEKHKVGKASMMTITAMQPVYIGLFLVCYVVTIALNISPAVCLPIGIIWAMQTILYTYYCLKTDKQQ